MRCGADDRTSRDPVRGCLGDGRHATAGRAAGEVAACYMIRQGDTAALVSRRMTGRAQQQFQPWFQILDAKSRAVPKSQYNRIQAGWRACIPSSRIVVARTGAHRAAAARTGAHRAAVALTGVHRAAVTLTGDNRAAVARTSGEHRPATAKAAVASGGVLQVFADSVAAGAWWGVAVFVVVLLALDGVAIREASTGQSSARCSGLARRFVCEFERPLRTPGCRGASGRVSIAFHPPSTAAGDPARAHRQATISKPVRPSTAM